MLQKFSVMDDHHTAFYSFEMQINNLLNKQFADIRTGISINTVEMVRPSSDLFLDFIFLVNQYANKTAEVFWLPEVSFSARFISEWLSTAVFWESSRWEEKKSIEIQGSVVWCSPTLSVAQNPTNQSQLSFSVLYGFFKSIQHWAPNSFPIQLMVSEFKGIKRTTNVWFNYTEY